MKRRLGELLVYVEFISRSPEVTLEEFHRRTAHAQTMWADSYGDDEMVLNVGRTWRIGPGPEYLCVWYSAAYGLERIDDWERLFAAGAHDSVNVEFEAVARIDRAGCYTAVIPAVRGSRGRYYFEWFELVAGASPEQVRDHFDSRAKAHKELELNAVGLPLGPMAPRSLGFAAWGLPNWGAAQALAVSPEKPGCPVHVVDASLYADLGHEQL
jgi:hypothetical protein